MTTENSSFLRRMMLAKSAELPKVIEHLFAVDDREVSWELLGQRHLENITYLRPQTYEQYRAMLPDGLAGGFSEEQFAVYQELLSQADRYLTAHHPRK